MQDRYFEEFEGIDDESILIDLYSVTGIWQVPLKDQFSRKFNTYICTTDQQYPVKESYETVKKAVEQAWMQKKNREHYEHGMMSQPWGQGPSYN